MTPDQITQLRQLLNRAQDYAKDDNIEHLNSIDENQTYKWIMRDMFQAVSEALALLPCETCNGTGVYEHTTVTGEIIPVRCFHGSIKYP